MLITKSKPKLKLENDLSKKLQFSTDFSQNSIEHPLTIVLPWQQWMPHGTVLYLEFNPCNQQYFNILFFISYNYSDNIQIFKPVMDWLHSFLIKLGKKPYDIQMLQMPQCSLVRTINENRWNRN